MPNKQKCLETGGSALMVLALAGFIAAAILPWYQTTVSVGTSDCTTTYSWFVQKSTCSSSETQWQQECEKNNQCVHQRQIYNAAYALDICAIVILAVGCIFYILYALGTRDSRCIPIHLVAVLFGLAAIITFAVGLPNAQKQDNNSSSVTPFFNGKDSGPGIGWWIALAATVVQLVVFIFYFIAFRV